MSNRRRILKYMPIELARSSGYYSTAELMYLWRRCALAAEPSDRHLVNGGLDPYPFEVRELELSSASGIGSDLRRRMSRIVLGHDGAEQKWRRDLGLWPMDWFRWHRVPICWWQESVFPVDVFLKRVGFSPNDQHPKARTLSAVSLLPSPKGWKILVYYGYRRDIEEHARWRRKSGLGSGRASGWRMVWETHDPSLSSMRAIDRLIKSWFEIPQGELR